MNRIDAIFSTLDSWRHLPAYQLERRADIFFALYLPDLVRGKFGFTVEDVLPEFPIRIGSIRPKNPNINLSFKVDYLVTLKDTDRVLFIELKTDNASMREKQDWYLKSAGQVGMGGLLDGLRHICKATKSRKYLYLLKKLHSMGVISLEEDGTFTVPSRNREIQIIYIRPNNEDEDGNVMSFREAAAIIGQHGDELSQRFAASLLTWAKVAAGGITSCPSPSDFPEARGR